MTYYISQSSLFNLFCAFKLILIICNTIYSILVHANKNIILKMFYCFQYTRFHSQDSTASSLVSTGCTKVVTNFINLDILEQKVRLTEYTILNSLLPVIKTSFHSL